MLPRNNSRDSFDSSDSFGLKVGEDVQLGVRACARRSGRSRNDQPSETSCRLGCFRDRVCRCRDCQIPLARISEIAADYADDTDVGKETRGD